MTPNESMVAAVREWAVRPDYSDVLVDSFIRTAESNLSRVMRVSAMVKFADATVLDSQKRVPLPPDWRELDMVRVNNGKPLRFRENSAFYADTAANNTGMYTIIGDYIEVGGNLDNLVGLPVEIAYYCTCPHIGDNPNWLFTKYYDLYLQACLVAAFTYSVEMDKAAASSGIVTGWVADANDEHRRASFSGSTLVDPRIRRR